MIGSSIKRSFICNECVENCNEVLDPDASSLMVVIKEAPQSPSD